MEWLTGAGPDQHEFGNGDPFTEKLKKHNHIENVRNTITKRVKDGNYDSGTAPYYLGGVQGVPKYFIDYSVLLTGGLTGNLAVTFLGSYKLEYFIITVHERTGEAVILFHVHNTSTAASGFRPPVIGYTDQWDRWVATPLNNFVGSSGPMSKKRQEIWWTETIKYR